jgi:hypothetical protein
MNWSSCGIYHRCCAKTILMACIYPCFPTYQDYSVLVWPKKSCTCSEKAAPHDRLERTIDRWMIVLVVWSMAWMTLFISLIGGNPS